MYVFEVGYFDASFEVVFGKGLAEDCSVGVGVYLEAVRHACLGFVEFWKVFVGDCEVYVDC